MEYSCNGTKAPQPVRESPFTVHRIPLFEGGAIKSYLDLPGPEVAHFAVKSEEYIPDIGVFPGDILVCRKEKTNHGDLVAIKGNKGFSFIFARCLDYYEAEGKVVLILKRSVRAKHYETLLATAVSIIDEKLLVKELARRAGVRPVDLQRSIEVLKAYKL